MRDLQFDSYAQISPYRDTPNQSRPAQAPQAQPAPPTTTPGAPSYPSDASMQAWRTGGYSTPKYTAPSFSQSAMAGWDQTKWSDPNKQDPKYAIGRIMSNYAPTSDNAAKVAADIQRAYPGTTYDGKDTVNIPGVGVVDFLEAFNEGGRRWQWGAQPTTATGSISPLSVAINSQQQQPGNNSMNNYIQQLLASTVVR